MNVNDLNNNLDFEKINATLANPDFANWYYSEMSNKIDKNLTVQEFVNIVNAYNENNI